MLVWIVQSQYGTSDKTENSNPERETCVLNSSFYVSNCSHEILINRFLFSFYAAPDQRGIKGSESIFKICFDS